MNKRQLIDEIVSLNPTAEPGFLARFDDGDLRLYLQHLREAQRPRVTVRTGRYDKYFQNVRPQADSHRPAARPAASSTWRVEPARQTVHAAQGAAGSLLQEPQPQICQPAVKDAAAEVELDRLADEDLDLAIRKNAEQAARAIAEADEAGELEAAQTLDQDEGQEFQPPGQQDDLEVTAEEKAALAWGGDDENDLAVSGQDELDGEDEAEFEPAQFEEADEEAEPFVTALPVPADAIQAVEQVLAVSQRLLPIAAPAWSEEEDPAGAEDLADEDEQPAGEAKELISALEAEPAEPEMEPSLPPRARKIRTEESDAWLF